MYVPILGQVPITPQAVSQLTETIGANLLAFALLIIFSLIILVGFGIYLLRPVVAGVMELYRRQTEAIEKLSETNNALKNDAVRRQETQDKQLVELQHVNVHLTDLQNVFREDMRAQVKKVLDDLVILRNKIIDNERINDQERIDDRAFIVSETERIVNAATVRLETLVTDYFKEKIENARTDPQPDPSG